MELVKAIENSLPTVVPIFTLIGWFIYRIDKRFDKVDKRFDKVDERFNLLIEKMDERFDKVDKRFNLLIEKMDERFDKVDERFDKVHFELKEIRKDIAKLSERIAVVETENIMSNLFHEPINKRSEAMKRVWEKRRKKKEND